MICGMPNASSDLNYTPQATIFSVHEAICYGRFLISLMIRKANAHQSMWHLRWRALIYYLLISDLWDSYHLTVISTVCVY